MYNTAVRCPFLNNHLKVAASGIKGDTLCVKFLRSKNEIQGLY